MLKDILLQQGALSKKNPQFWTHAWTLIEGCSPVSAGCKNCWLAAMEKRYQRNPGILDEQGNFNGNIILPKGRLDVPFKRKKPSVYAIWSDLFLAPDNMLESVFIDIEANPQHYFLIVTKREPRLPGKPLKNVIILITIESFVSLRDRRSWIHTARVKGWKVGILVEPMLSYVNLADNDLLLLNWIICGPENGPGKRPFNPQWAIFLAQQAGEVGIPFFFKHNHGTIPGTSEPLLEIPEI